MPLFVVEKREKDVQKRARPPAVQRHLLRRNVQFEEGGRTDFREDQALVPVQEEQAAPAQVGFCCSVKRKEFKTQKANVFWFFMFLTSS